MSTEITSIEVDLELQRDDLAKEIAQKWQTWDKLRTWKEKVIELREYLFATDTKNTTNAQNESDHTSHRPKLTQIYDTLKATYLDGLLSGQQFFRFEGEEEDAVAKEKRRKVEAYLQTKHRQNGFREVVNQLIDDWLQTGNAIAGVDYKSEKLVEEDGTEYPGYIGPMPYRKEPFDVVFNPAAKDWSTTPKILRTLTDLGTLLRKAKEHPDGADFKVAVQRAIDMRGDLYRGMTDGMLSQEDQQKYSLYEMDGFGSYTEYLQSSAVELLTFYGDIFDPRTGEFLDRREIVIIDRNWVLINRRVQSWDGKPAIFKSGWRDRPNNLWSMGPLENLVGLQFRINHLENTRADQFDDLAFQDLLLVGDVEESFDEEGRRVFRVAEGGDARYLSMDATVLNADLQIENTERAMEVYAGVPRESAGFRSPGEKTKFEVENLVDAATRLFINKMQKFETEILEPMLLAEVEVGRRNIGDTTEAVKAIDDDTGAAEFLSVTRQDLSVKGRLVPLGSRHFAQQAKAAKDLANFQNILAQDKEVAEHVPSFRLAKLWQELLGFESKDLVVQNARVTERVQRERLVAAAQTMLTAESDAVTDITPDGEELTDAEAAA